MIDLDTRVGFCATSILEAFAQENVLFAYNWKQYSLLVEYSLKYEKLREYNTGGVN